MDDMNDSTLCAQVSRYQDQPKGVDDINDSL